MSDAGLPYLRSLKSAVSGGLRPSALIERKKPHGEWKWYDYTLFEAVQRVSDETCSVCGLPLYVCRSNSSDIQFDVRVDFCNGAEALERKRKALTPKDGQFPSNATLNPDPFSMSGKPLSSYRDPYWEGVLKVRAEKVKERQEHIDAYMGDAGS